MARREYTPEEREQALAHASQHGPAATAKALGIPRPTLHKWMHQAGLPIPDAPARVAAATAAAIHRKELARARLDNTLLAKAQRVLDRIDQPHEEVLRILDSKGKPIRVKLPRPSASAVRDYAVAAGVLIDKYRLEMGEATSRNENRDITNDDHERELLRDAIKGELARRAESARRAVVAPPASGADEAAVAADETAGAGATAG